MTPDSVLVFPLNVRIRNYRGKILLGGYEHAFELSESATFMCRQIDGTRTVRDIGQVVAAEFDVDPQTATQDATELFTQLVVADVVTVKE
ncbi:PqqD family protein [Actinophytocola sp.]|uniref:PqqD family protein n=1 Tax=Actinophytocola sp. TaxID=1872138 RepID=UPI002D7E5F11|nr:PqqD family protein [Actinophytocola sp.]HET9140045.1 PqqD family protein [Actinophytocola sp.]